MHRRKVLKAFLAGVGGLSLAGFAGWRYFHFLDGPLFNACLTQNIPDQLTQSPWFTEAFADLDPSLIWDCHVHLVGTGANKSGSWVHPNMRSWSHPIQKVQYSLYMDAACITDAANADAQYVEQLNNLLQQLPTGIRFMLLAFDYHHNAQGEAIPAMSTFYTPNDYAANIAQHSSHFEWIASIHPYRRDAVDELYRCVEKGARAVKWLPPAHNIDPSSRRCDAFYDALIATNTPLLSHAGDEKAVHAEELQKLGNPLRLRRPLDKGVTVIIAHCASLGTNQDIDTRDGKVVENFSLFARLMDDAQYDSHLFADVSAVTQINRPVEVMQRLIEHKAWHSRLLHASDYPLPGVAPLISAKRFARAGLLPEETLPFLYQVRQHNAWLFDFLLKRHLRVNGEKLSPEVFMTRKVFA